MATKFIVDCHLKKATQELFKIIQAPGKKNHRMERLTVFGLIFGQVGLSFSLFLKMKPCTFRNHAAPFFSGNHRDTSK